MIAPQKYIVVCISAGNLRAIVPGIYLLIYFIADTWTWVLSSYHTQLNPESMARPAR